MTTRDPPAPLIPPPNVQEKPASEAAQARLAKALRENLKRRKAQERARESESSADRVHSLRVPHP